MFYRLKEAYLEAEWGSQYTDNDLDMCEYWLVLGGAASGTPVRDQLMLCKGACFVLGNCFICLG